MIPQDRSQSRPGPAGPNSTGQPTSPTTDHADHADHAVDASHVGDAVDASHVGDADRANSKAAVNSQGIAPTAPGDSPLDATPMTGLPRLITAMAISNIGVYIALLTPLQLLLTLHLIRIADASATTAFGAITGLGAMLALVANPLGGRISDRTAARFGRRRTWILTGSLAGAAVLAAMAWTTQVWQVALTWCVVQTLLNFQQAAANALMPDQIPRHRRGTASGLLGMTSALGPLIGLSAVAMITNSTVQWLVVALAAALGGTGAVLLIRERPLSAKPKPIGLKDLAKSFWLNPARHPAFGWAWLVRFLITCAYASSTYNAFYLMRKFGVSEDQVGDIVLQLSLLSTGLLALTSAIGGVVSDRLGRQKPFVIAAGIIACAALVVMAMAPNIAIVYLAVALVGVGTGLFFSIDTALCVRMLPSSKDAGKDLAVINMANTIPQSVVPFIAPALLWIGGFTAFYLALAVLGVLGAIFVLRLPEMGREGDPRWAQITRQTV